MGSGDWNDGMNRVGHEGRGESVWLGWFLCKLVADFAPVAHARCDSERALRWESAARGWKEALLGPPGMARGSSAPSSTTASRWARKPTPRPAST